MLGALRVVAQGGHAAGDVAPDASQGGKRLVEEFAAGLADDEGVVGVERAYLRDAGFEAVGAQDGGDVVEVLVADLDDGTEFL